MTTTKGTASDELDIDMHKMMRQHSILHPPNPRDMRTGLKAKQAAEEAKKEKQLSQKAQQAAEFAVQEQKYLKPLAL